MKNYYLEDILGFMQSETKKQFGDDFHVSETSDWYRENFPIAMGIKMLFDELQHHIDQTRLRTADDPYFFGNASNFLFYRKMPASARGFVKALNPQVGAIAREGEIKLRKKGTDIIYKNTKEIKVLEVPFEFEVIAINSGVITNANKGEVTELISSPENWGNKFENETIAGGQDIEKLEDARKRFFNTGISESYWNVDGVKAELLRVNGVKSAYVRSNSSDEKMGNQPRRSIWCVVEGGRDEDIANAIFKKFTDATYTYGSVRVKIRDIEGAEVEIGFDRPTDINIDIKIEAIGIKNTDEIKDYVKEYIDSVPVAGLISSSKALSHIPNIYAYDVAVSFKKQGTDSWVQFIQLGNTEKGKYGVV